MIGERCNLNCHFCYQNKDGDLNHGSDYDIKNIIQLLLLKDIKHVILSGGEPLLYDELFKIIESLEDAGIEVSLCTNAILADDVFCRRLICTKVRKVTINIASIVDNNYFIHESNSNYNSVIAGIKNFVNYGLNVTFNDLVFIVKKDIFLNKILFCANMGVSNISFIFPIYRDLSSKKLAVRSTQFDEAASILQEIEKEFDINITLNNPICIDESCPANKNIFGIDVSGNLLPCLVKKDI